MDDFMPNIVKVVQNTKVTISYASTSGPIDKKQKLNLSNVLLHDRLISYDRFHSYQIKCEDGKMAFFIDKFQEWLENNNILPYEFNYDLCENTYEPPEGSCWCKVMDKFLSENGYEPIPMFIEGGKNGEGLLEKIIDLNDFIGSNNKFYFYKKVR